MEKNQKVVFIVGSLVIGILIGYFVANADSKNNLYSHQMPDGTMMPNDHAHNSMEDMMHDMTESLEGKTGSEFDKEFLVQMIVHHEGAVEMARMVLKQSKEAKLQSFAQNIIDAQTSEIKIMQNWLDKGFTSSTVPITSTPPPTSNPNSPVACTMEAKICPDGSAVGRQGPNCEFAKCPGQI